MERTKHEVERQQTEVDHYRRRLLAAGATGAAAAGLAGFSPASLAQQAGAKPLPPFASFKDAGRVIVHSASGIETKRSAFGTSGITSQDVLFVRNNIAAPNASITENPDAWAVEFDGVSTPRKMTLGDLKKMGLANVSMVLQCSGNGRGFFAHKASGSPWKVGAAGNTMWSGVPVKAIVQELGGVREGMRYMTSTGGETIPPGVDPKTVMVERSVPWTAMEEAILAWELNGDPLSLAHGGPVRLIIPGYYGVNNVKYIKRLAFTAEQTGANIQSSGYRVRPIGQKGTPTQPSMWEMNLKSFVTSPSGEEGQLKAGPTQIHGVAWSGGSPVSAVEVSLDGGKTWRAARFFGPDLGRYAWRQFVLPVRLAPGSYEVTSRAIAADGEVQPELRVENERAYAHNGWRDHAVKVTVA
jgi:DMSO/TMAO reductase YedYZ molybdopterin-dependent catalytic subunit